MILQRLVDYYDRISADPTTANALPKTGYSLQKMSFCVVLKPDGTLQHFQTLMDEGAKKPIPRMMLVPGQSKPPGQGINPCFLWDNSGYLLGFKLEDPNPGRTQDSFEAFREQHLANEAVIDDAAYRAVCAFLRAWSPERAAERVKELEGIIGSFGCFKIAGELGYVHESPKVAAYWSGREEGGGAGDVATKAMCLVTGQHEPVARLHEPKIKGVVGGQPAGGLLVSFNDQAYESLGKSQGDNAPVGRAAAFKYANALNYLLGRPDRRFSLGDATVVFWADQPVAFEEVADAFWGGLPPPKPDASPEDQRRAEQVKLFLSQLRAGHATGDAIDSDDAIGFYVLGLSPNASRISVRFWEQSTVGQMKDRLAWHLRDTELVGARPDDPPLTIRRIIQATGRAELTGGKFKSYDADAVPPIIAGAVARAVFTGLPYPAMLLSAMLNRLRADGHVSHARVATIKACLAREARFKGHQEEEVPVALDTSRSDPGYVTGRLFALLEKIQADSDGGDLNATIKDRYFSAASATPGLVFPRLIRLSQHHLAKMETAQKVYHEKRLGEVIGKLQSFPSHLMMEDQGLFAIGYFHQRQDLFKSKKDKEGGIE